MKLKKAKQKNSKLYEWQGINFGECQKCHRKEVKLTVDHIIPVAILRRLDDSEQLVLNDEENFAHLCVPCNTMKADGIDITNPKTAQLLTKYMKPYLKEPTV